MTKKQKLARSGFEPTIFSGIYDRGSARIELCRGDITLRRHSGGAWIYDRQYPTIDLAIDAASGGDVLA